MKIVSLRVFLCLCALAVAGASVPNVFAQSAKTEPKVFDKLKFRQIGPFRGGRSGAVTGVPGQANVYYFGATGGGVWKTTDGGINWEPISDGFFGTGSVGALAVSDSDPNVLYVGMGEETWRGNVSHGDGVYKSTDAGKTWKKLGLENTRHISRIRIHPKNPDVAYVGAMGHCFGPNEERGVFRTTDGGKTWQKILFKSNKAGVSDLAMDANNPRVLFAGFWEAQRSPYSFSSGGEGSGLWKTTDGGDTWTEITRNQGLPKGVIGKVGVSVSPVDSQRVWAIVEAEEGGLFRSDDGGDTWSKTSQDRNLRQRAWYYTKVYADPKEVDTVYVLNVNFHKSIDGGRSFSVIGSNHGDHHDLWIAPDNPKRMILGDDGGGAVSTDGGGRWTDLDQPTAQFYRVTVDDQFPFNIYGAQQDNSTVKIKSRSNDFGIGERDWYDVGGGESGWIAPSPVNPDVVFAGSYDGLLTRYDHKTGQTRDVNVYPDNPMGSGAEGMKYRFQWNFPLVFSKHEPNALYAGGNILFKSTDDGQSWTAVSPDLTRNDKTKQVSSGGPITKDNTSVEYYCTIFAVSESPVRKGVWWAGSDDGLIHVTQDGEKWDNVTPRDLPEWIQINAIDASPHDAGTAYVAATKYKSDDFRPYLYKTTDFGKTWKKIVKGLPENSFTRVVREDPRRKGLLYAGTETGLYVSFDDGENWQPFQCNVPVVPVTDLVIHKRDNALVVATQGRAFWVLDDLTVVQQAAEKAVTEKVRLFKPETAYRLDGPNFPLPKTATIGQNPASGAVVYFNLNDKPAKEVKLIFSDLNGKELRTFIGRAKGAEGPGGGPGGPTDVFQYEVGLNRFVWDTRLSGATRFPGLVLWAGDLRGPKVVPGAYQVTLVVDGEKQAQSFEIKKDPRVTVTPEEFQAQFDMLLKIRDKVTETHKAILNIRDMRKQLDDAEGRAKAKPEAKELLELAKTIREKLTAIEETLVQTKIQSGQDPLNFPIKLNNKLAALTGVVGGADGPPTTQAQAVYADLTGRIDAELQKLDGVMKGEVAQFNAKYRELGLPLLAPR